MCLSCEDCSSLCMSMAMCDAHLMLWKSKVGGRSKAAVGGLHEGAKRDIGRPEAVHVVVGVEVGSDGWQKVYSA